MVTYTYADVSKMIDHSLLNPTLTAEALQKGINTSKAYDVASVCIMPFALAWCREQLEGTDVRASTTIGFPHGGQVTAIKVAEAEQAIRNGGQELDMVVNISKVLSSAWSYVHDDVKAVLEVAHGAGQKIKVIFENCYLNDDQKVQLCEICGEMGADWVKTSTGYGTGGATLEDLRLMRKHSPANVQVKAAGGVRDMDKLLEVRDIGVTRVGATATAAMMDEARRRLGLDPIAVEQVASVGY